MGVADTPPPLAPTGATEARNASNCSSEAIAAVVADSPSLLAPTGATEARNASNCSPEAVADVDVDSPSPLAPTGTTKARNATLTPVATLPNRPRSLSVDERLAVLATLNEPRFQDQAPSEVYATLLDEGVYLCSERTMYRILDENRLVRDRRNQLRHPAYTAPELMAQKPNQLWTWDITKLKTFVRGQYFHLYVILDVYSRYVVGWMVADHESGELAKALIDETHERQQVLPGELTFHADNGAAMVSKPVALLLSHLGVIKSHSRPYVSDDNPFSEAQFKTLKYRPDFPEKFASLEHARTFLRAFFDWYNNQHHHDALALLTPHDVHHGLAKQRIAQRQRVLDAAYAAHPERFVRRPPLHAEPPATVWINPPKEVKPTQEKQA